MRSAANSSCSSPSTTDQPPRPSARTGKPNCRPSGVPYWPSLATATERQSPSGVAVRRLTTVSMAALAADAAEEAPRASMIAAPASARSS